MDDIYEPLSLYRDHLKEEHAKNTAVFFEEMVRLSGVDESANVTKVAEIRSLEKHIELASSSRSKWNALKIMVIILVIFAFIGVGLWVIQLFSADALSFKIHPMYGVIFAVVGVSGISLISRKLNPIIRSLDERLAKLKADCDARIAEAWEQLAPLNELYQWDTIAKLVQKTAPNFKLDPFFSRARLNELYKSFGLDDSFNKNKSILFCQSGEIKGNPFVLGETINFQMGSQTYYGSITITWREQQTYTDSQGRTRTRWVTRTQVLTASVEKPAPQYNFDKFLLYGNEAAPDLTFSRSASELSSAGDGMIDKMRIKHKIGKLEKETRKLNGYTIMSNQEFDALFHAVDRNHEIQFRLLFTPLVQQEMLKLLRDKSVGFGDNFSFEKNHKINIIRPAHLTNFDISAAPSIFQNYDLSDARKFFNDYSNNYFRSFFFAFAPLLTIPLYQQHRSHEDIYKDVYGQTASFWEYESIANYHGEARFRHQDSITRNILKTQIAGSAAGATELKVIANGFRGVSHIEYVPVWGGDGKVHNVPVEWIEYIPVSKSSTMVIRETEGLTLQDFEEQSSAADDWQKFFRQWQTKSGQASFRRSIVSIFPSRN